ncbi:MAG: aminopeptidase [Balneolales bacterium]|nr:aminopeptidase [Balneolales bacterium]
MLISEKDQKLAENLLSHSCDLKKGEHVLIQLVGLNGIGLVRALCRGARERGAIPFVKLEDTETNRILMETGDTEYWQKQAHTDQLPLMKQMDAFIGIRAAENIYENSSIGSAQNKAYSDHFLVPVHFEERVNNTKWCILRYPSPAFAMNAKMPTQDFAEFYYKACLLDYEKLRKAMLPLEERLRKTDEIRLKGEGTDIRFSVKNQNWIPCYGTRNIPDGELFSSPIIDSVEGEISYAPSVYQGKPFEFVKLRVKQGKVVDFDSSDNEGLRQILETDEGASRFGEFSFGTNPVIEKPMYDILFDEKIYGSNHLTLGQDYDIAPNGNHSSVHWDLVCIGADVYLDGDLARKGRIFVSEELKGLNPDQFLEMK